MEHEVATGILEERRLPYTAIPHARAFTAHEVARVAHIHEEELAKTIMVWIDEALVMAVLHADERLDLRRVKEVLRANAVRLATEREFEGHFPDCELGAMPPFGNRYGLPVIVSPKVAAAGVITFNAGSHTELVRMSYSDFDQLVHPCVADIVREAVV